MAIILLPPREACGPETVRLRHKKVGLEDFIVILVALMLSSSSLELEVSLVSLMASPSLNASLVVSSLTWRTDDEVGLFEISLIPLTSEE